MIAIEIGGESFFPDAFYLAEARLPEMPPHKRKPFADGFLESVAMEMQRRDLHWPDVTLVTDRLVGCTALAPFLVQAKVVLLANNATPDEIDLVRMCGGALAESMDEVRSICWLHEATRMQRAQQGVTLH